MRHRSSVLLVLPFVLVAAVAAQTPSPAAAPSKAAHKKRVANRAKHVMKRAADTVVTASAGVVADTLLGKHAGTVATAVSGGVPGMPPSCGAGLVAYPVATTAPSQTSRVGGMLGAGGMPMIPTPGGVLVNAAKRRMHGEKQDSAVAAASVAGAPQYRCGTLDEATASMQAAPAGQQSHLGVGTILSATPQGMMITGAIAAAPMARSALSRFGGRFGRGQQSRESMSQDLQRGILRLKSARFVEGSAELAPGFEKDMSALAEALSSAEGQFLLNVPGESDGAAAPDTVLAERRISTVAACLLAAGIPSGRVVARGVHPSGLDAKSSAPRIGETRIEILRIPPGLVP